MSSKRAAPGGGQLFLAVTNKGGEFWLSLDWMHCLALLIMPVSGHSRSRAHSLLLSAGAGHDAAPRIGHTLATREPPCRDISRSDADAW